MSHSWNLSDDHKARYFPYADLEVTLKAVRKFCKLARFVNSIDISSSYFTGSGEPGDEPGAYWTATVVYNGIVEENN